MYFLKIDLRKADLRGWAPRRCNKTKRHSSLCQGSSFNKPTILVASQFKQHKGMKGIIAYWATNA